MMKTDHFVCRKDQSFMTEFISHRGESMDAPENTLEAFALAQMRNSDGMECDIHLTADNVLVTAHDSNTLRVSKVDMVIERSTFDELQKLDVSYNKAAYKNVRIPRFADTLRCLTPGRKYYVEIKENDERVIHALASELEKANVSAEQIVMISFHADIVKRYKELYPERQALYLLGFTVDQNGSWSPSADQLIEKLAELGADGADIGCNLDFITAEYVQKVHAAGYKLAVWTVDDPVVAGYCVKYNIDAVTSNRAAFLRGTLLEQVEK